MALDGRLAPEMDAALRLAHGKFESTTVEPKRHLLMKKVEPWKNESRTNIYLGFMWDGKPLFWWTLVEFEK